MSLINCKNNRNTCGTPFPSTCVSYDGAFKGVLKESDFACNVNLDDVIEKLSEILKTQQDGINTLSVKVNEITDIKQDIVDLKADLQNLDTHDIYVNIDLGCLASSAAPCQVTNQRYSLFSILQLFKNEICSLKS